MKTSLLASIDTGQPVGNSTNYMELESNTSVYENFYPVSQRMWTPLDLDPLYTPLTKLILFSFSSIMRDSELKDCKGNLIMFFEYFQVIQLILCEPLRLTGIKYPNNNCLKNCLIIPLRTLVRAPSPSPRFFSHRQYSLSHRIFQYVLYCPLVCLCLTHF